MKTIIGVLILFVTTTALADWVEIERNEGITYYLDLLTIKKDGNVRRVWHLQDLDVPDKGVRSRQTYMEYDCKNTRYRMLDFSVHSD